MTPKSWTENEVFCKQRGMEMVKTSKSNIRMISQFKFDSAHFSYDGVWLAGKAVDLGKWRFLNNVDSEEIIAQAVQCMVPP